jgi:hypothetical protein
MEFVHNAILSGLVVLRMVGVVVAKHNESLRSHDGENETMGGGGSMSVY